MTGAASLFRRELLEDALPFPPAQFAHFHDHWIGLTALALGDIAFVDRPLYDYVQHGERLARPRGGQPACPRCANGWRRCGATRAGGFACGACTTSSTSAACEQFADGAAAALRRRACRRPSAARWSASCAPTTRRRRSPRWRPRRPRARSARPADARRRVDALPRPRLAADARRRAPASAPSGALRLDALPPPTLAQEPGRGGLEGTAAHAIARQDRAAAAGASPTTRPSAINLLIPTIDLDHFFGGYIAKFNLARRLAERDGACGIVTVDPVGPLPRDWRRRIESYSGLEGLVRPRRGGIRPRVATASR